MNIFLNIAAFFFGCAAYDGKFGAPGDLDTGLMPDSAAEAEDTGQVISHDPAWWWLHANLSISKGEIILEESSLQVELQDEFQNFICIETFPIAEIVPEKSPSEVIYSWWSLVPGTGAGGCAEKVKTMPLPARLQLGVGDMHPEISAVLGSVSQLSDGAESIVNGAYVSFDDPETLYVYGVAGLEAAFNGEGSLQEEAPLSDGDYTVLGVYAFAVTEK